MAVKDKLLRHIYAGVLAFLVLTVPALGRREQDPREAMQQVHQVMNLVQALQQQQEQQERGGAAGGVPGAAGGSEPALMAEGNPYYNNYVGSPYYMAAHPGFGEAGYPMHQYPVYDYYEEAEPAQESPKPATKRPTRSRTRDKQRSEENEPLSFRNVFTTFVRNLGWAFTSDTKK